jgi:hypothetical protein
MSCAYVLASAALLAAAVLAGCGPDDPYTNDRPNPLPERETAQAKTPPPASGELPGHAPRELLDEPTDSPEARESPRATLALAARLYGNWTSANADRQLRRVAALSVGQARAELRQAAAQSSVDNQQRGARSRASVEAISVRGQGSRRRGLVITREHIVAAGLPSEGWRYRVTVAALERRANRWVLSRWAPQP